MFQTVVISSGHGKFVRGASGVIDEVDEARRVVDQVASELAQHGIKAITYHDDVSTSQNENLNRIVDFHNSKTRDLDISVHFNAYEQVEHPMGCEVLYVTQQTLAARLSAAIAQSGFIDRGAKQRTDLFFLNNTAQPAVLLEICFVDSEADCDLYGSCFEEICGGIADTLAGEAASPPVDSDALLVATGPCSHFGGPDDTGVAPDEGLAFIYAVGDAPHLFLPYQPDDTSGLARRLNPFVHYIACRWDYDVTPREMLLSKPAQVTALKTGITLKCFPADWGPHQSTARVADLSPSLMADLGITTDDEIEVVFPA
jgi:N-acetylmuramoyl-L-alanine amidase